MKKSALFVLVILLILASCWQYTTIKGENEGTFVNEEPAGAGLNISKKGLNFPGCLWLNMPVKITNDTAEWPLATWCTIGYNYDYLYKDFLAMKKMGVKHIRLWAEIYSFMIWDPDTGYKKFNPLYLSNIKEVFQLADDMGFEVTFCMMTLVKLEQHPSFECFYESFDPLPEPPFDTPAHPVRLKSIHKAFGDLVAELKHYQSIHSWEMVNEANLFAQGRNYSWDYCLREIFGPIRQGINRIDGSRPVLVSFAGLRNASPELPKIIVKDYSSICDYYDGHYYSNTVYLPDLNILDKPIVLGEVGAHCENQGPLFHPDRAENVRVLKEVWNIFEEKGYSSFMPWEFNTFVKNYGTIHKWRWDSLLLYTLYTNDDVDFISSNYYVAMITEPEFEGDYISFDVFEPEPPDDVVRPEIITNTLRTLHPFYGKPINQGPGKILNTCFPADYASENRETDVDFRGRFKTTIYELMECSELPITVNGNTVTTLKFTDYSTKMEMIAQTDLGMRGTKDDTEGNQIKQITMTIGNYPAIITGQERFGIEPSGLYLITSKDMNSQEQESWTARASSVGTLTVTIPLFWENQQVTIKKDEPIIIDG